MSERNRTCEYCGHDFIQKTKGRARRACYREACRTAQRHQYYETYQLRRATYYVQIGMDSR